MKEISFLVEAKTKKHLYSQIKRNLKKQISKSNINNSFSKECSNIIHNEKNMAIHFMDIVLAKRIYSIKSRHDIIDTIKVKTLSKADIIHYLKKENETYSKKQYGNIRVSDKKEKSQIHLENPLVTFLNNKYECVKNLSKPNKFISEMFGISLHNARKILQNFDKGSKTKTVNKEEEILKKGIDDILNEQNSIISIPDLRKRLNIKNIEFNKSNETLRRIVRERGFRYKRVYAVNDQKNSDRVNKLRNDFIKRISSVLIEGIREIIFLDEVSFTSMTKSNYSWARKGKGLVNTPLKRMKSISIIAVANFSGIICWKAFKGSVIQEDFFRFLNEYLEKVAKGNEIIVLDNAAIHKKKDPNMKKLCFLSPYSPEFNPIENMFAVWKNRFRKHQIEGETGLMEAISLSCPIRGSFEALKWRNSWLERMREFIENN